MTVEVMTATVTQASPLRVRLDGASASSEAVVLGTPPALNARVRALVDGGQVVVLAGGGDHPDSDHTSIIPTLAATDGPGAYPVGLSIFHINAETGWPDTYGTVITHKVADVRCRQEYADKDANTHYVRTGIDATTWTAWKRLGEADHTHSSLTDVDGRGSVEGPSVFTTRAWQGGPRFHSGTELGLPGSYYGVVTVSPWGDDTGGGVHQTAYGSDEAVWHRYGTRAGGWKPWRPVSVGDTAWATVTAFTNGWAAYNTGNTLQYRKTGDGMVIVRGILASGTYGAAAFTLPAGYRPGRHLRFATTPRVGSYPPGRTDVATSGAVIPQQGSNAEHSIENITYLAEA